jgi:hypothetical protein
VAAVRLGYRGLLLVALPAWLVTRLSAQWLASEENVDEDSPAWVDLGSTTTDTTFVLLVAATVCAGLAVRRVGREGGGGAGLHRAVVVLVGISLVAYLVVIWAMTTKPS